MSPLGLHTAWQVLRIEGMPAAVDRMAERWSEARRRRSFRPAPAGWQTPAAIPVLLLAATPPAPRLGGVQVQLLARLSAEPPGSPIALLYPEPSGWRLEIDTGTERRALIFPGVPPSPVALEDPAFEAAVRSAVAVTGAKALQAEGLAGLPFVSLLHLQAAGLRQILSLHDFAAFCPRPHLLEHPDLRFCRYSHDLDRCGRCLAQSWPVDGAFQAARREAAASLLPGADALIFSSEFLRRQHLELFPDLPLKRSRVIAPAGGGPPLPPRPPRTLRHVALVSGLQAHKGARVFVDTVRRLAGEGLQWTVYGGVDPSLAPLLRDLPDLRVRGSFRGARLPELLRRDRVDLALLPSIVPESYSLALGECVRAGVSVLAFDLGALADRVPQLAAGRLVPVEAGAEGMATAIREMLREEHAPMVPADSAARIESPKAIAAAHRRLQEKLLFLQGSGS